MKVLLTGASGLLGGNVARLLHQRGYALRLLARPGSRLDHLADLDYELVETQFDQAGQLPTAVHGCDAVIHAAANTAQWPNRLDHFHPVNVQATIDLVTAAREAGVGKFVFVSTANTIGPGTRDAPGNEWNEFELYALGSGYINSKFLAERYVLEQAGRGFPAVVVNPTFMLGELDVKPSSGRLLIHALQSRRHWVPPGGKNFIPVRDAAQGVVGALEKGRPGERYLLAGENLSFREFFALVDRVADARTPQVPLPRWLILLVGRAGDWWGRLSGQAVPINAVTSRLMCLDNFYTGAKAREELAMPDTPLEEGIREAIAWFRAQGMIE
ncbi:MAG: NAD-dependent epimerase/dehydratase family protein [Lewinella sp.]|nr:NAD-dependent epimerase/dehydratase family protein [Lewinella sp.]